MENVDKKLNQVIREISKSNKVIVFRKLSSNRNPMIHENIPVMTLDKDFVFNGPNKLQSTNNIGENIFKQYEKENLYAWYQGKSFLIHEADSVTPS